MIVKGHPVDACVLAQFADGNFLNIIMEIFPEEQEDSSLMPNAAQQNSSLKIYIENLVVTETRKLLTKENIDRIAKEVVQLCEQEKDTDNLKRLKKLLKENERATENLFKALENGQIVDVIAERISQKKREHNELEQQILVETSSHPTPTVNEVRFFLNQFRKGNVNDLKYRQALVDTFVNKIYLYDDKMTVLYNTQDSHSDVTVDDLSSSRVALVEVRGVELLLIIHKMTVQQSLFCYWLQIWLQF